MKIEQLYTGCLAQGAYYIESNGEAAIIDPLRETQPYIEKLEESGVKLKYILETHFHADFVSGHVDLAAKTGATIVYGPGAKTGYEILEAKDNQELKIGDITLVVLHTPGHTPESTTYLLRDEKGEDHAIFSGDTLFIGDVGRPDLAVKSDLTQEDLASLLFDSLRNKIMPLSDDIIVYPAHGAGSACGKNMSSETTDTLGNQKKTNYALRADMTREEFIKEVTHGILPPPQYFPKNARINKEGYESIDEVLDRGVVALTPVEFEFLVSDQGALMLDTREPQTFAAKHIPNAINIGIDGSFASWVGTLITDLKQPIVFIADEGREEEIVTRLARVGYDHTLGFLKGGMEAWEKAGFEVDHVHSISAKELEKQVGQGTVENLIDVRKETEYLSEHLEMAENFPLDYINKNMAQLDKRKTYHIHCAGGYRSMITASILKARGFEHIVDVQGGFSAIAEETSLPKTDYVCPSTL